MKTSTLMLLIAAVLLAFAGALAWRGQVCMPTMFLIAMLWPGTFGMILRDEGN